MESVENAKWELQWDRINFLALLITVTVFAWVYHKGLPSSVKAIIRERFMHKLTATVGSHLNRRNLDKSVLCSVMLGVTGVSWPGFGRLALLTHRIGSCASLVCECQEVFNHLPQGTCFIHFFWRKYVCVDMCTCTVFLLSVKPVGAASPAMEILEFLVTISNFNCFCSFSGNLICMFWWCTSHEIPEWGGITFPFFWWKTFPMMWGLWIFLHLALMIQSILGFHLVMVLSAAGDETPCSCLLSLPLFSFPIPV